MQKFFLVVGTLLGGLGVILGAFGAHGLKKLVEPETVATYQTGVQYQVYHAFALLFVGLLAERLASPLANTAGYFFLAGIILFSGSLYLIVSMHAMNRVVPTAINLVTPIGGLLFIAGWVLLLISIIRK
jgi:uncharacterized membrane protein YgdD (TMEM256/DUF423 family)